MATDRPQVPGSTNSVTNSLPRHGALPRLRSKASAKWGNGQVGAPSSTWIRREFHCFPSKVAEHRAFVSEMLQQSLDFYKHNFNPPGVLIYESDGVSHPPTFE